MSSYVVNANIRGFLGASSPATITLRRQELQVTNGHGSCKAYDLRHCTVAESAPSTMCICFANKKKLVLELPSPRIRMKFVALVTTAATFIDYVIPEESVWDRLISVASDITTHAPVKRVKPCGLSVGDVQAHIDNLTNVYNHLSTLGSPLALYAWLLELEAEYVVKHRSHALNGSYAHAVYKQSTLAYALGTTSAEQKPDPATFVTVCPHCKREYDRALIYQIYRNRGKWPCGTCGETIRKDIYYKNQFGTSAFDVPLREVLAKCPLRRCSSSFSLDERRRMHLLGETITCSGCQKGISYESFQIAALIQVHPTIEHKSYRNADGTRVGRWQTPRELPRDGRWSTYITDTEAAIKAMQSAEPPLDTFEVATLLENFKHSVAMIRAHAVGAFPVDLVQVMHQDLPFVAAIAAHAAYWTNHSVIAAAIRRYEQFVHLSASPLLGRGKRPLAPTVDIALIWRVHRTMHENYCAFSRSVADCILVSDSDATAAEYIKACIAWSRAYKEPYSSHVPSGETPETLFNVGALLAVGDSRFHGVDEVFYASELTHATSVDAEMLVAVIGTPLYTLAAPTQAAVLLG
ncbi:hypothetical protein ACHHYP_04240 [Achlya hypogyna]|uniref:Uncharacterized protein n=1 Tax=Achlya hypogyna TaxID=1202772 RepID=A0A1V9ZPE7_ACHHY|nr:hypothetical protein ACHHYP_04240 [Achlya hypogyna]